MAKETVTRLIDDLDGSEAAEEVTFAFRGTQYVIDLSAKNVAALEKLLQKYIQAGRPVKARVGRPRAHASATGSGRSGQRAGSSGGDDASAIRAWALANDVPVAKRGRVGADVREAYRNANAR